MKLIARAPIEGVAGVVPDKRPGDTFEAKGDVASDLIDSGKAEPADQNEAKAHADAVAKAKAKAAEAEPKEGHETKAELQVIKDEADAEAAFKAKAAKGK